MLGRSVISYCLVLLLAAATGLLAMLSSPPVEVAQAHGPGLEVSAIATATLAVVGPKPAAITPTSTPTSSPTPTPTFTPTVTPGIVTPTPAARLFLEPSSASPVVGEIFTMDIGFDTGGRTADTVQACIGFDPVYLEVVTASGAPATSLEVNPSLFDFVMSNTVNNATGQIYFAASQSVSPYLTGTNWAARIRLKAKAKTAPSWTPIDFVRSGSRCNDLSFGGESLNPIIIGPPSWIIDPITLDGRVSLEKRGSAGDPGWVTELFRRSTTDWATILRGEIKVYQALTSTLLGTYDSSPTVTTDAYGRFTVVLEGIGAGTYDVEVKGADTLSNKKANVALPSATEVYFGTLLVGDANGDNDVNGLDVSYMIPSFWKCVGDPGYRPYADTNKDGCVNGLDVSATIPNFWKQGPIQVGWSTAAEAVEMAKQDLSFRTGVDPRLMVLLRIWVDTWPSACEACLQPGYACPLVFMPVTGYGILLLAAGSVYEYHAVGEGVCLVPYRPWDLREDRAPSRPTPTPTSDSRRGWTGFGHGPGPPTMGIARAG